MTGKGPMGIAVLCSKPAYTASYPGRQIFKMFYILDHHGRHYAEYSPFIHNFIYYPAFVWGDIKISQKYVTICRCRAMI